ncbi:hypothetical protein FACS1894158_13120 [Betaproteobacteria bacterium]|nr:hypothetical protein FACS1894158_13120 [Betaproteobacteria bacterium]
MTSYDAVLAKIEKLEKQASALKAKEKGKAIASIRKLIEEHNIQQAELFSKAGPATTKASVGRPAGVTTSVRKTRATRKKQVRPPKYLDPATGKTWNGHGKPPAWLGGVSNRDKFLIAPLAVEQSAESIRAAEELKTAKPKKGERGKAKPVKAVNKPKKTRAKRGSKVNKNAASAATPGTADQPA